MCLITFVLPQRMIGNVVLVCIINQLNKQHKPTCNRTKCVQIKWTVHNQNIVLNSKSIRPAAWGLLVAGLRWLSAQGPAGRVSGSARRMSLPPPSGHIVPCPNASRGRAETRRRWPPSLTVILHLRWRERWLKPEHFLLWIRALCVFVMSSSHPAGRSAVWRTGSHTAEGLTDTGRRTPHSHSWTPSELHTAEREKDEHRYYCHSGVI